MVKLKHNKKYRKHSEKREKREKREKQQKGGDDDDIVVIEKQLTYFRNLRDKYEKDDKNKDDENYDQNLAILNKKIKDWEDRLEEAFTLNDEIKNIELRRLSTEVASLNRQAEDKARELNLEQKKIDVAKQANAIQNRGNSIQRSNANDMQRLEVAKYTTAITSGVVNYVTGLTDNILNKAFRFIGYALSSLASVIKTVGGGFLNNEIFKALAPYIALFIVIAVLFFGLRFGLPTFSTSSSTPSPPPNFAAPTPNTKEPVVKTEKGVPPPPPKKKWLWTTTWSPIFTSHIYGAINPGAAAQIPSMPRNKETAGRCDEVEWHQVNDINCAKTVAPTNINWKLKSSDMPEFGTALLNNNDIKAIAGGNESDADKKNKWNITIPYEIYGTNYKPNCRNATFGDGKSAAHLLEERYDSCQIKEVPKEVYTMQYRPIGSTGQDYATSSEPKCTLKK